MILQYKEPQWNGHCTEAGKPKENQYELHALLPLKTRVWFLAVFFRAYFHVVKRIEEPNNFILLVPEVIIVDLAVLVGGDVNTSPGHCYSARHSHASMHKTPPCFRCNLRHHHYEHQKDFHFIYFQKRMFI